MLTSDLWIRLKVQATRPLILVALQISRCCDEFNVQADRVTSRVVGTFGTKLILLSDLPSDLLSYVRYRTY
jgi:hypothetical protein